MNPTFIRAAALYLPSAAVLMVLVLRPTQRRLFAAALVSFCWTLPSLLALQLLNLKFHWWSYHAVGGLFRQMPVDLYLGWAALWGVLPILCFRRLPIPFVASLFAIADLLLMPLCRPVVELHARWLVGEAVALLLVLLPALCFARWTLHGSRLYHRVLLQVLTTAGIFLLLFPEIVFHLRGGGWAPLLQTPAWLRGMELQLLFLLALPSLTAVQEFAYRGLGTPIPYDPPQRLVATGIYRYIANPMQLSAALTVGAWGVLLHNPWIAAASLVALAYSVGVAGWDERADLDRRFGGAWRRYRHEVHDWRFRWRPYVDRIGPRPRLYIAENCEPCSKLRRWLEARDPFGLELIAAEDHPTHALQRLTYVPMDGSPHEQGTRAFARALEHLHLGWALVGALMRLPLLASVIQVLADASGFGPRTVPQRCDLPRRAA